MRTSGTIKLIYALVALLIVAVTLAGATYSLFNDEAQTVNRVQAGTLEIGLSRVRYEALGLDEEGYLTAKTTDDTVVDLLAESAGEAFTVEGAVPGMWKETTLKVDGSKATVAFTYSVKLIIGELSDAAAQALSEQVEITVTDSAEKSTSFSLDECADNTVELGIIEAGGSAEFKIKAEFANDINNNAAKNAEVVFDLIVTATQTAENR